MNLLKYCLEGVSQLVMEDRQSSITHSLSLYSISGQDLKTRSRYSKGYFANSTAAKSQQIRLAN